MTELNHSNQEPPTSPWSIISLIGGIANFVGFPFWGSVVALITGYIAQNEIQKGNGQIGGERLAKAGLILGWIGVGLSVLSFLMGMLVLLGVIGSFAFCGPLSQLINSAR